MRPSRAAVALTWLSLPVYVWQGLGVRRRTARLTPPENRGWYRHAGSGEPFRLLLIGDSSAAGVGVDSMEKSLGGILPRLLAERTGRPVDILVAGMNSATAADLRDHVVPHVETRDFTHIVLNVGANDAKNFHTARRFYREFGTLLYALRARFPTAEIIWSGVLDMARVPALPHPLNRILGVRSRVLAAHGRVLCRERGAHLPESDWRFVRGNFSTDGFHASEAGYREWAGTLADFILRKREQGRPG
jgi:lysophospholipase L1-like esterase